MPLSKHYVMYFLHLLLGFAIVKDDLRALFLLFVSLLFSLMAIWPSRECIVFSTVYSLPFPFLKKCSNSVQQPKGNWADTGIPVQLGTGFHPAPWQPGMSVVWLDQLTVPHAAETG